MRSPARPALSPSAPLRHAQGRQTPERLDRPQNQTAPQLTSSARVETNHPKRKASTTDREERAKRQCTDERGRPRIPLQAAPRAPLPPAPQPMGLSTAAQPAASAMPLQAQRERLHQWMAKLESAPHDRLIVTAKTCMAYAASMHPIEADTLVRLITHTKAIHGMPSLRAEGARHDMVQGLRCLARRFEMTSGQPLPSQASQNLRSLEEATSRAGGFNAQGAQQQRLDAMMQTIASAPGGDASVVASLLARALFLDPMTAGVAEQLIEFVDMACEKISASREEKAQWVHSLHCAVAGLQTEEGTDPLSDEAQSVLIRMSKTLSDERKRDEMKQRLAALSPQHPNPIAEINACIALASSFHLPSVDDLSTLIARASDFYGRPNNDAEGRHYMVLGLRCLVARHEAARDDPLPYGTQYSLRDMQELSLEDPFHDIGAMSRRAAAMRADIARLSQPDAPGWVAEVRETLDRALFLDPMSAEIVDKLTVLVKKTCARAHVSPEERASMANSLQTVVDGFRAGGVESLSVEAELALAALTGATGPSAPTPVNEASETDFFSRAAATEAKFRDALEDVRTIGEGQTDGLDALVYEWIDGVVEQPQAVRPGLLAALMPVCHDRHLNGGEMLHDIMELAGPVLGARHGVTSMKKSNVWAQLVELFYAHSLRGDEDVPLKTQQRFFQWSVAREGWDRAARRCAGLPTLQNACHAFREQLDDLDEDEIEGAVTGLRNQIRSANVRQVASTMMNDLIEHCAKQSFLSEATFGELLACADDCIQASRFKEAETRVILRGLQVLKAQCESDWQHPLSEPAQSTFSALVQLHDERRLPAIQTQRDPRLAPDLPPEDEIPHLDLDAPSASH